MTGTTSIVVCLPENMLADLDRWRNDLANRLGRAPADRSEAIRAILEGHFEGARSRKLREAEPPTNNISESARMAGKAIDRVSDQHATSGERAQRKHDLIEGSEEFKGQRQARERKNSK